MGKVTAQPASNMLSRTHPSLTASAGSLMLACGLLALTAASHTYASVVISLFAIGAGSSLLAFPAACLYSHHRAASAQRSYVTLAVVEFIGMYFLGVATVSCFASLKFSSIVVSAARRHRAPPSLSQRAGGHRRKSDHGDRCRFVFKNSERHVRARLLCRAVIYLLCCRGAAHALTRLARRCMTFAALYFMKSRAQQAKAS